MATELLPQNPVLLDQVLDHLLLATIDPSSHSEDAELQDEIVHARQGSAVPTHASRRTRSIENSATSGPAEYWYRTSSTSCRPYANLSDNLASIAHYAELSARALIRATPDHAQNCWKKSQIV